MQTGVKKQAESSTSDYVVLRKRASEFASRIKDEKLRSMFVKCFFNTLDTTANHIGNHSYVITGDIDAMWLRDSSAQVMQYLEFGADCKDTAELVKGLIRRQMYYIACDPYANAFNPDYTGAGHIEDECEQSKIVFERKFELDSLCYPIFLSYKYYNLTKDSSVFDNEYIKSLRVILDVFKLEQRHENSKYYHYRPTEHPSLSVPNRGRGGACAYTGMVWSGYRPSDDPCEYGYFVPGNMFVSVILGQLLKLIRQGHIGESFKLEIETLKGQIDDGIKQYAVVRHEKHGEIFAYETDGLGGYNLMDDANVPSLLSIPYLGYLDENNSLYQNTRNFILSKSNPYYFEGKTITGVGSPHTPKDYVWHISLIVEALTSSDSARINSIINTLKHSDAGTGYMHEGVHCDDDSIYTRSWFAWANSLFSYLLIKKAGLIDAIA